MWRGCGLDATCRGRLRGTVRRLGFGKPPLRTNGTAQQTAEAAKAAAESSAGSPDGSQASRIRQVHARFDLNGDGEINVGELKEFVGDEAVATTIIQQLDTLQAAKRQAR